MWSQDIYILPQRKVIGNYEGEGVPEAKLFKDKYGAKVDFAEVCLCVCLGGWGVGGGGQTKSLPLNIFLNLFLTFI